METTLINALFAGTAGATQNGVISLQGKGGDSPTFLSLLKGSLTAGTTRMETVEENGAAVEGKPSASTDALSKSLDIIDALAFLPIALAMNRQVRSTEGTGQFPTYSPDTIDGLLGAIATALETGDFQEVEKALEGNAGLQSLLSGRGTIGVNSAVTGGNGKTKGMGTTASVPQIDRTAISQDLASILAALGSVGTGEGKETLAAGEKAGEGKEAALISSVTDPSQGTTGGTDKAADGAAKAGGNDDVVRNTMLLSAILPNLLTVKPQPGAADQSTVATPATGNGRASTPSVMPPVDPRMAQGREKGTLSGKEQNNSTASLLTDEASTATRSDLSEDYVLLKNGVVVQMSEPTQGKSGGIDAFASILKKGTGEVTTAVPDAGLKNQTPSPEGTVERKTAPVPPSAATIQNTIQKETSQPVSPKETAQNEASPTFSSGKTTDPATTRTVSAGSTPATPVFPFAEGKAAPVTASEITGVTRQAAPQGQAELNARPADTTVKAGAFPAAGTKDAGVSETPSSRGTAQAGMSQTSPPGPEVRKETDQTPSSGGMAEMAADRTPSVEGTAPAATTPTRFPGRGAQTGINQASPSKGQARASKGTVLTETNPAPSLRETVGKSAGKTASPEETQVAGDSPNVGRANLETEASGRTEPESEVPREAAAKEETGKGARPVENAARQPVFTFKDMKSGTDTISASGTAGETGQNGTAFSGETADRTATGSASPGDAPAAGSFHIDYRAAAQAPSGRPATETGPVPEAGAAGDASVTEKLSFAATSDRDPGSDRGSEKEKPAKSEGRTEASRSKEETNPLLRDDTAKTGTVQEKGPAGGAQKGSLAATMVHKIQQMVETYSGRGQSSDMVLRLNIDEKESLLVGLKDQNGKVLVEVKGASEGLMSLLQSQKETITRELESKHIYTTIHVNSDGEGNSRRRDQRDGQARNRNKQEKEGFRGIFDTLA